jgi:pyruvate formate lyase activating enzyme
MKEALLYKKNPDLSVVCAMCAHRCTIKPGKRGICSVRENQDGTLVTLIYGKLISAGADPIEKKPLFHFIPGTRSYSIASVGCNFRCRHCQNSDISQLPRDLRDGDLPGEESTAQMVVAEAMAAGCDSISYTYTEPTIFMEFALETAKFAREKGLKNVFVSNGYMTPESVKLIAPYLDANNIDLKGDDGVYRVFCGGRLAPVQETISLMKENNVWVEVTTNIIPDINDSDESLTMMAKFIASVDKDIPWHVTRFMPAFEIKDKEPTPLSTLKRAREIGMRNGIKNVYIGNHPGSGAENTECFNCGVTLIERSGFKTGADMISGGSCFSCGINQPGVWE